MSLLSQFYPNFNTSNNLTPRIFGCTSFVHIHNHNRGKLDPRAVKCVFVGYSSTQKGYRCYQPTSKKFFVSVDVTFNESSLFFPRPYLQGGRTHWKIRKSWRIISFSLTYYSPDLTQFPPILE